MVAVEFFLTPILFQFPDFDNHIFVTTDAEAFFFLHDLISSYVKEKQRVLNIQQQQNSSRFGSLKPEI